MPERSEGKEAVRPTFERIVATSEPAVEGITYFIETEAFGVWERLAAGYRSANAAVAYARAFLNNWRIVEVTDD